MALRKPTFMTAEGYAEEMAAADSLQLGGLTMSGNIVMGGFKVTGLLAATASAEALSYGQAGALLNGLDLNNGVLSNLGAPVLGTDGANKTYVDSVAQGLDIKESVRAISTSNLVLSGTQTVDGVNLLAGDRILVNGQTTASQNGIYVVAAGAWTRSADMAATTGAAGAFTFVEEGTAYSDTGWVCTNDVGSDVVATDDLTFTQFSGAGMITAGTGLTKTGDTINANGGRGILANADDLDVELDASADAQSAGDSGGSSGLEFDVAGAAAKLRVRVNATGGIERTATGVAAKLDGTTLQSLAAGLSVKGLPTLFEINGVATVGSVSAANLNTLTDGSDATALHTHQYAPKIQNAILSNEAISANDPVVWSGTNDRLNQARANDDARARVMGVTLNTAAGAGISLNVVSAGVAAGVLAGATAGTAYYLGATGGLTSTIPGGGNRIIQVGIAKNATDLWVRIVDYGKKAA